jgi:type I restriction enzyme M protein
MITGELKNKIDGIWNVFWSGGITNPLTVIEQITYLMFIKILDDNEIRKINTAMLLETDPADLVFDAEHQNCRWSNFRNMEAQAMFENMRDNVFPFITGTGKEEGKGLSEGKDTAFKRFMKNAIFLIPSPKMLVSVVQGIEGLDLEDKDIMGDVYEYLLSQIAQSGTNGQFRTPRHIIKMMVRLMEPTLEDDICEICTTSLIQLQAA